MNKKLQILSFVLVGFSQFAFGQIKEERLILDRKREPEVKRIEKKKTSIPAEKNYPPKEKKQQDSLNLRYHITDVPAVSDFKTSTIQGADISPKFGGASLNLYGHVKLQDVFVGVPEPSSSNDNPNSTTTGRGIAASPKLI